jgi:hypothetical protein
LGGRAFASLGRVPENAMQSGSSLQSALLNHTQPEAVKFLCSACERLTPVVGFRVEGAALLLRCGCCQSESQINVSAVEDPFLRFAPAPPRITPIHFAAQVAPVEEARPIFTGLRSVPPPSDEGAPEAEAGCELDYDPFTAPEGNCPKCIAVRTAEASTCVVCGLFFRKFHAEEHAPSEILAGMWRRLVTEWNDRELHDRVIKFAHGGGELASVGRLYRIRLARRPDDALALAGRADVLRRASAIEQAIVEKQAESPLGRALRPLALVALALGTLLFAYHEVHARTLAQEQLARDLAGASADAHSR